MFPWFPAVPSAFYGYPNSKGQIIPGTNNLGSREEQLTSLKIWYSMKSDEIFPLESVYTKAREDQIGLSGADLPSSDLSLSMKSQLRQSTLGDGWFFDDRFQIIVGQMKRSTSDRLIKEMYLYPLHPSADPFEAARLIEGYLRDGDETPIREYFRKRGVIHLQDHNLNYYPAYYLFFLMTRFASYPFTQAQLYLVERRGRTTFQSPEQQFIDAVFDYEVYEPAKLLQLIDRIQTEGPVAVGAQFGTTHQDWVRWGDEYLQNEGIAAQPIDNIAELTQPLATKLLTWTDLQLEELSRQLKLVLPMRIEYPTRSSYINSVAGAIALYRADPKRTAEWIQETEGRFYLPSLAVSPS